MVDKVKDNPAVQAAKLNGKQPEDGIYTHHSGVRYKIVPVSAGLIQSVQSKIKDPDIPMFQEEGKSRAYPNPDDPTYVKLKAEADEARNNAAMDAMILFGIELLDDIPDTNWGKRLAFLGVEFNEEDEIEREFAFKRHVLADGNLFFDIAAKSGIQREQIDQAVSSFQSD